MLQMMTHQNYGLLKILAALGCGLAAGVFFAFSTFVMSGLARLPAAQGIAAMQNINITAINPLFMTALFGTAAVCLLLAVAAVLGSHPGAVYPLTGCILYLVGTIFVTILFNVPLNDRLAGVNPASADSVNVWANYLKNWTAWNHVRTVTSLAAAALFTLSARYPVVR